MLGIYHDEAVEYGAAVEATVLCSVDDNPAKDVLL